MRLDTKRKGKERKGKERIEKKETVQEVASKSLSKCKEWYPLLV